MYNHGDVDNNKTAVKNHHAKNDSISPKTSGGSIIDITDAPDVAVWAKEVERRGGAQTRSRSLPRSNQ